MDFWLERALKTLDGAIDGVPPDVMSVPPAPGKWSIALILGHLSITYRQTAGVLRKVAQGGKPAAGKGSFRQWFFTRVVADVGYFPTGRPAPPATVPSELPPEQVVTEVHENLVSMDAMLREVEEKFGADVKVADHPVLGPFTVTEWRKFHYRHTHHHAKQIRGLGERLSAARKVGAG